MELKDLLTLILSTIVAIVGLATFIKALIEYRRSSATKRLELFLMMRTRLREDPEFKEICELLESDDPKLREIPLVQRDRFTGFFEELAIMHNSKLINDDVAFYMFGYFAIRCNHSENFWHGLNRNQKLWALFFSFAKDMEKADRKFTFVKDHYKV
ncbi:MAG: hypothetical protein ACK5ZE_13900 [Pseudanabaena sp.]|jgi:hypothetical protein